MFILGEPVSDPDDGLDHLLADLLPERADVDVDRPGLDVGGVVPETGEDRLAAHDPPRAPDQEPEEVEFLLREVNRRAVPEDEVAGPVDPETSALEDVRPRASGEAARRRCAAIRASSSFIENGFVT